MATAETAELVAELNLKGNFVVAAKKAQRTLQGLTKDGSRFRTEMDKAKKGLMTTGKVAAGIAAGGVALLAVNVRRGIESLAELEDVQNQTNAAIRSTKGVAGVSAEAVRELAERYEDLTTIDDKVIQGGENVLLTFTNIRKKAFEPTVAAALDMATALKMDTASAMRTLGRAIDDPAAGLARLTRLGITFTEEEKEKVKALVRTGRTLDAQQFILARVNRQYGGSAQAAAKGYRGQMNRLDDAVEDLQQSLAGALLPAMTKVSRRLSNFLKAPQVKRQVKQIGDALAGLFNDSFSTEQVVEDGQSATVVKKVSSPFTKGLSLIKEAFKGIQELPWDTIKSNVQTITQVGGRALEMFRSLPPEVQAGLVTLLAANKITGGALFGLGKAALDIALKAVSTIIANNVTVVGKTITGPGSPGLPGGGGAPGGGSKPGGPGGKAPAFGLGGAGVFLDFNEMQRTANAKLAEIHAGIRPLAPIERQTADRIASVRENTSLQARLAPVQNDILNGIANNTTTIPETGKATNSKLFQIASKADLLGRLQAQGNGTARQQAIQGRLAAQASLRALPLIGGVKQAAYDTANAIRRKDLSVKVTTTVSAVTNAGQATRVQFGNRYVV